MNAPLARYLTRFSEVEPVAALSFDRAFSEPAFSEPAFDGPLASDPEEDLAERLAAAREEALAEAGADAASQVLALTASHQVALTDALVEARARWVADEGATHAALIGQAFTDLREDLSRRIAGALKPLLTAALVERAQAAVSEAIDHIVADPDHPVVTVRGPSDLLDGIKAARAEAQALERITYLTAAGVEIIVDAAGTHVETKLAAALAAIEEI